VGDDDGGTWIKKKKKFQIILKKKKSQFLIINVMKIVITTVWLHFISSEMVEFQIDFSIIPKKPSILSF
jgi:hypothetical protein